MRSGWPSYRLPPLLLAVLMSIAGWLGGASHPVVFETMDATSAHAVVAFIGLLEDFRLD